jgi:hypothetical protein
MIKLFINLLILACQISGVYDVNRNETLQHDDFSLVKEWADSLKKLEELIFHDALKNLDLNPFKDQRIIIKGCSKYPVPPSAYLEITSLLRPLAKSIMYGEACSTVPIFKRK